MDDAGNSTGTVAASDGHVDQPGRFAYRPALDGIRAVAVLAVLVYHGAQLTTAKLDVLPGGFLGVDLFFVLSGYLITTLLLLEFDAARTIRLGAFYLRRARRLLPALVLVLTAVAIAFLLRNALGLDNSQVAKFRGDAASSVLYVANWRFAFSGQSYFDQFGDPSPLRHLWSLAIEEQFYFVWPALLFVFLRYLRADRVKLAVITAALTAASVVAMVVLYNRNPGDASRAYYGTDTRAQAMLIGALLAIGILHVGRDRLADRRVQAAGFAGLAGAVLLFRFVTDQQSWMYRGGFTLLAVCAALAIAAAAATEDAPMARVLAWRPLVWVGTLSYGVYLWHWPIFVVVDSPRVGLGGPALLVLRLSITFGVAYLSYHAVEKPIRFGALRERNARSLATVGGALAAATIIVAMIVATPGGDDLAALTDTQASGAASSGPVQAGDLKVAFFGDSVPMSLLYYKGKTPGIATDGALTVGCGVVRGDLAPRNKDPQPRPNCEGWPERWQAKVQQFDPDVSVVLVGAWEVFDHIVDGQLLKINTPEYAADIGRELDAAHDALTATGRPMVLMTTPCHANLKKDGGTSDFPERDDAQTVKWLNTVYRAWIAQHRDVELIDLHAFQCPTGEFVNEISGKKLSDDGTHYTKQSAPVVWAWLEPQLEKYRR